MKTLLSILILGAITISCQTKQVVAKGENKPPKIKTENDSTQYEVIIFDPIYDSFLATQPPKEFYSQQYYENWNTQYVTEWNIRHSNPIRYGDFYETDINYEQGTDYGLELNYKLYYYFLYIEKEYGITLVKRGKTSR